MMGRVMFIVLLCMGLAGCASVVHTQPVPVQENLLVPCSTNTPIPQNGTGSEVLQTLQDWQTFYNACASSKDALIKSVNSDVNYRLKVWQ